MHTGNALVIPSAIRTHHVVARASIYIHISIKEKFLLYRPLT